MKTLKQMPLFKEFDVEDVTNSDKIRVKRYDDPVFEFVFHTRADSKAVLEKIAFEKLGYFLVDKI